jgi:tryptophanyl-tRNA synthetase
MAARIVVFKAGNGANGGDLQDHSIAALNAIRGATAVPTGADQAEHSRLLPRYVAEGSRNTWPAQYGGQ